MMTDNKLIFKLRNGLLFFIAAIFLGCSEQEVTGVVLINGKATAVSIPRRVSGEIPADSLSLLIYIKLKNDTGSSAILGQFSKGGVILFTPLLPFTHGSAYEIFIRGIKVDSFRIPPADASDPTRIMGVYPQRDTLPENLLKIYFQFSHPMQEGRSADYIKLIRNNTDTLHDVFLDLQPELWNEDRTVLTLWLDLGRIKRGLQPNLRLGSPLHINDNYTLLVGGDWRDGRGLALETKYQLTFVAGNRDSLSPDPEKWRIRDTNLNGKTSIHIDCKESLDHFLLMECLSIINEQGRTVKGSFVISKKDDHCIFIPEVSLAKGKYVLKIESRLEDIAGNNINKPFDRDTKNSEQPSTAASHNKTFTVR